MKKIFISLVLILSMLFAGSCSLIGSRTNMLDKMDDGEAADARLELVLEAIKNEDKDALESMFSQTALQESDDFDGSMEYLFSFVQGDVVSWERYAFSVGETIDHGESTKSNYVWYKVNMDQQEYYMYFVQWTVDTEHPENVGIYALRVVKAEDDENLFCYYQDMEAGIFEY